MLHSYLVMVFLPFVSTTVQPSDYRLRVQTVRYENVVINGKKQQKKTLLRQIQIHIRRNSSFHNEVIVGDRELVLEGKLETGEKGDIRIQIQYTDSKTTDQKVPGNDGRWHRIKDTTSVTHSSLGLRVGAEMSIGGMTCDDGKKWSKVEIRVVLLPVRMKKPLLKGRRPPGTRPIHTDARFGLPDSK